MEASKHWKRFRGTLTFCPLYIMGYDETVAPRAGAWIETEKGLHFRSYDNL